MVIGVIRDPSGLWDLFLPRLSRSLPLTHLICADPTGTFKHVEQLQISFEIEPVRPADSFFCILLFLCDHLDSYKRHKSLIDGFVHDPFVQARSWIVAVVSLATPGPIRPARRLIERIESDLSDRLVADQGKVIQVDLADGSDRSDPDPLSQALKWCVIRTAELRSAEFEGRLRSMQQSGTPLDFHAFFTLKESYSLFYQDLGLHDDALRQYGELDAVLDTLPLSSTGSGMTDLDWAALLLSDGLIPLPSVSSPYHYLSFIFSRQIRLLSALDRIPDLYERASRFLRHLQSLHYDTVIRTVQIVAIALSIAQISDGALIAELLLLALSTFEKTGYERHLIEFDMESMAFQPTPIMGSDSETDVVDRIDFSKITAAELQAGFESRSRYERCYTAFAELVWRRFQQAQRWRFASSICSRLGILYYGRGQIHKALQLFESGAQMPRVARSAAWAYCRLAERIMSAQCHYALNDLQSYLDTVFIIMNISTCQQEQLQLRFRNQFLERMDDQAMSDVRRPISDLVRIVDFGIDRSLSPLHTACETDMFCHEIVPMQLSLQSFSAVDVDVSAVEVVLESSSASQRITMDQIVLHPGPNRLIFDHVRIQVAGRYWPVAVRIRIRRLVLESFLDRAEIQLSAICVRSRTATATLHLDPIRKPLVLGRRHQLSVECQSNFDQMTQVQLTMQSITNPALIKTDQIEIVDHDRDSSSLPIVISSSQGCFEIGDIARDSQCHLIVHIQSPLDGILHQELALTLNYIVDGVPISTSTHSSLVFTPPLMITSMMETVLSRTFIQVLVRCSTEVAVHLDSYRFQPGPFTFQDLNSPCDRILISPSTSGYAFVFEIFHRSSSDGDIDDPDFLDNFVFRGRFHIQCQPIDGVPSEFDFPVHILSMKRHPSFLIHITSTVSRSFLGHPIPINIRIARSPQSTVSTPRLAMGQFAYDLVYEADSWYFAGRSRGLISLQQEVSISAVLIPIRSGFLPIPTLKLAEIVNGRAMEIEADLISAHIDPRQVLILPQGRFAADLLAQN